MEGGDKVMGDEKMNAPLFNMVRQLLSLYERGLITQDVFIENTVIEVMIATRLQRLDEERR